MESPAKRLALFLPGLLVAATGVGAGDLATGAFSGSELGLAVLWAVLLGAFLKFILSEGLARWQLVTGETLLEGALLRAPAPLRWAFLGYLVPWSWFVGAALIGACGVTAQALLPISEDALQGKLIWGVVHSALGLVLVWRGGFQLFERMMSVAIGVMFVTVVATAVMLGFEPGEVARGLFVPSVPDADGEGLAWTIALIGGVGGTLTLLCYGYWIREAGREGPSWIKACRADLAVGFSVTAIFGVAMVMIGSRIAVDGRGSGLIVALADALEGELGAAARWAFLLGAWGAVFSSLVGVWQSVPYVFADFWRLRRGSDAPAGEAVDTSGRVYRSYLLALAIIPVFGLTVSFKQAQLAYAVVGAAFLPLLALALLVLLGSKGACEQHANRWWTQLVMIVTLLFFAAAGVMQAAAKFG
jgi:Mn2+/Fe2+ NRAMP family transporter